MYAEIIGPDILILVVAVVVILPVGAVIDAAGKPGWAFERAGTNKALWIALPIVGIFVCGLVGIVASIVWFASTRAKVVGAMSSGSYADPAAFGGSAGVPPPLAPSATPAGWFADPAARHELRYFDGRAWTEHVSDNGAQALDPL